MPSTATATSWRTRLSQLRLSAKTSDPAVFNATYFRGNGVVFHLYALLTSKTGANLPGVAEGWTKVVRKVPAEIKKELSKQAVVKAEEAAARGELWYLRVGTDAEGVGWRWNEKNGAKAVVAVHTALTWLLRFRDKKTVDGAHAFYVEINNTILGQ